MQALHREGPIAIFRIFLAALFLTILIYTLIVGFEHGWGLVPLFFGEIQAMTWQGQFNLDFMTFLLLSGIWVMWRHKFSPAGIGLGLIAIFGGMAFLSVYLLIVSFKAEGDTRAMLLGVSRHRS